MSHQPKLRDKPAGTPISRFDRFQNDYPVLYASRHVALAVLKALLPLLGLGALAAALLQSIDLAWLHETGALIGSWLSNTGWPFGEPDAKPWFTDTPWFEWLKWTVRQAKWVVAIILALLVAVQEVARHSRRTAGQPGSDAAEKQAEQLR